MDTTLGANIDAGPPAAEPGDVHGRSTPDGQFQDSPRRSTASWQPHEWFGVRRTFWTAFRRKPPEAWDERGSAACTSCIAGTFPHPAAVMRLVAAILVEVDWTRSEARGASSTGQELFKPIADIEGIGAPSSVLSPRERWPGR